MHGEVLISHYCVVSHFGMHVGCVQLGREMARSRMLQHPQQPGRRTRDRLPLGVTGDERDGVHRRWTDGAQIAVLNYLLHLQGVPFSNPCDLIA